MADCGRYKAEEVRHASRIADSACPFCIGVNAKKDTLSQHFVMCVIPPLSIRGVTHDKVKGVAYCTTVAADWW